MSDWQPIETAPKDGTPVLIFAHPMMASHDGGLEIAYWSDCFGADRPCWIRPSGGMIDHFPPTHWMPLPSPPKAAEATAPQLRCLDCLRLYRDFDLDMTIPDEQWVAIVGRPGGVLCPSCMVARLAKLPGSVAVRAYLEAAEATETQRPQDEPRLIDAKESLLREVWVEGRAGNIAAMIDRVAAAALAQGFNAGYVAASQAIRVGTINDARLRYMKTLFGSGTQATKEQADTTRRSESAINTDT